MRVSRNQSYRSSGVRRGRGNKPTKSPEQERFDTAFMGLLQYANAHFASCIYFEPPIKDDEMALNAFRIMLDIWDNEEVIEKFAQVQLPFYRGVDYDLVQTWTDGIVGPMMCMETSGNRALILCEGHVFDVLSLGRSWDSMVPNAPDMIITGLLPFDNSVVGSGLVLRCSGQAQGAGVERVWHEFEEGKKAGVIANAEEFVKAARLIKEKWRTEGLDPSSYVCFYEAVRQMNDELGYSSFPYFPTLGARPWTEEEQAFHV